jgi:hypothetical protein
VTIVDLDAWIAEPEVRVTHRRTARAERAELWEAARSVRLRETPRLGRLIHWRIPGLGRDPSYDELFHNPPMIALEEREGAMVSGLCGRIWRLHQPFPRLCDPEHFRDWATPGTVRVLYANWVEPAADGRSVLVSETRVAPVDRRARLRLLAVRPLIGAFHHLIASEPMALAVRRAEVGGNEPPSAGSS